MNDTKTAAPRYRVKGSFFDNWQMHEDGAEVEYLGEPGENLIPLNAAAKARAKGVTPQQPAVPADQAAA